MRLFICLVAGAGLIGLVAAQQPPSDLPPADADATRTLKAARVLLARIYDNDHPREAASLTAWRDRLESVGRRDLPSDDAWWCLLKAAEISCDLIGGDASRHGRFLYLELIQSQDAPAVIRHLAAQRCINFPYMMRDSFEDSDVAERIWTTLLETYDAVRSSPRTERYAVKLAADPAAEARMELGPIFLNDALRRTRDDPRREELARAAIRNLTGYIDDLRAGRCPDGGYFPSMRVTLWRLGLAHAVLGDEKALIDIAKRMQAVVPRYRGNHGEAIGSMLRQAGSVMYGPDGVSQVWGGDHNKLFDGFLERYEALVSPDDAYYIEYVKHLFRVDLSCGRADRAASRIEGLLASQHPDHLDVFSRSPDVRANLIYWLARCYIQLGRQDDAIRTFERLIVEHPTDRNAEQARAELNQLRQRGSRN